MASDHVTEEWRRVSGFGIYDGHYSVSNLGRVRRETPALGHQTGRILKNTIAVHGYCTVALSLRSAVKRVYVHRLVAIAFLGPCPDGCEVSHKDHNRANPRLDNLEYATHLENLHHSGRGGRLAKKLTNDQVGEVFSRIRDGHTFEDIASDLNVHPSLISHMSRKKCWKHHQGSELRALNGG